MLSVHNLKPTPELSSSLIKLCQTFAPNLTTQLVQSATRIYFNRQENSMKFLNLQIREQTTYLEDIASALEASEYQDCEFIVEDKEVKAHKAIVCTRCPYIRFLELSKQ